MISVFVTYDQHEFETRTQFSALIEHFGSEIRGIYGWLNSQIFTYHERKEHKSTLMQMSQDNYYCGRRVAGSCTRITEKNLLIRCLSSKSINVTDFYFICLFCSCYWFSFWVQHPFFLGQSPILKVSLVSALYNFTDCEKRFRSCPRRSLPANPARTLSTKTFLIWVVISSCPLLIISESLFFSFLQIDAEER